MPVLGRKVEKSSDFDLCMDLEKQNTGSEWSIDFKSEFQTFDLSEM